MRQYLRKLRVAMTAFVVAALFFHVPASSERAEPGTVRILLSWAAVQGRMDVGVYGRYLINDTLSFQQGSKLKVEARPGGLWLYYEGAAVNAGDRIYLKRMSSDEGQENGLRLNDSLNLLEGDLIITASGENLRAVLHIGVEDYLKGLVPYEMSDSFPLEALKAQAVAARSYALSGLRQDRDYDLTDDSNDQVYKGFNAEHRQAHRAVDDTRGLVLTWKEQLINAYYTASNGGQTESARHAWGMDEQPYLNVHDDPYDAENPESLTKSFAIPKTWQADTEVLRKLEERLLGEAKNQLEKRGFQVEPDELRIGEVLAVTAENPKFDEDSRVMTMLRFRLKVHFSGARAAEEEEISLFSVEEDGRDEDAAGQAAQQLVEAELPIFPDMEQLMGLSINIRDNEIVEVKEGKNEYLIVSGRYGHGVGMSQRGAEQMAGKYGKTYQEILSFYYPGTALSRYRTVPETRPHLEASFLTTPGPIPTPTPRPTLVPQNKVPAEGQWEVTVKNIQKNSSLNLRMLPSTSSDILYQLFYGQRLLVLARSEDGWLKVEADGISGYVMESFVERLP